MWRLSKVGMHVSIMTTKRSMINSFMVMSISVWLIPVMMSIWLLVTMRRIVGPVSCVVIVRTPSMPIVTVPVMNATMRPIIMRMVIVSTMMPVRALVVMTLIFAVWSYFVTMSI